MFGHPATSPYDAFFTSGLLSAARTHFPHSSSSTSPTSPDVPISPRRGSLPDNYPLYSPINDDDADYDDENDDVFNFYDGDADDTMYFTLQPRAQPSAENLRSFLSLDLAESQSMRSASLRRKPSTSTARSNWSRSTLSRSQSKSTKAYSGFRFPETIPELPSRLQISGLPQPPHSAPIASSSKLPTLSTAQTASANNNRRPSNPNLRPRFSRDSLRTIPSPKPAPCITLPEPPKTASSRAGTPVSVHAPVATSALELGAGPTTAPVSVPASAASIVSTASTSLVTPVPEAVASSSSPSPQAQPKTPVKTKAPPRLPSLQPIPLELNIRMSALFASPPKPKPAASRASVSVSSKPASLAKAPSTASSRFISPASRKPERKNRDSVLTTKTATTTRTVSTRARRWNRSEALARLEGRSPVSPRDGDAAVPSTPPPAAPSAAAITAAKLAMRISTTRNFMSMSDDEDDESELDGDIAEEDSGNEMVFLRQVAEDSDEDADEDLDFDDGCSSSSSSSSGSASSYVSLDVNVPVNEAERQSSSTSGSGGSGLSFPSSLSLRGLVGRMAGLNPFMEAEDVVLPVQTPPASQTPQAPQTPIEDGDADVDIDDNFRFPAPPRTTAAERRLSLALSFGRSSFDETLGQDEEDTLSVFDTLFLEAPRSAPLPPPPPPYSPFAQTASYSQSSSSYSPYSASASASPTLGHHALSKEKKEKKTHHLAVPHPLSGPSSHSRNTSSSLALALPGLRRKRTKTRRGRDHTAEDGLVSFIDFPDFNDPPASAPPAAPLRIGERSDSLPEDMRELRRQQRRARYGRDEAAPKTGSNRSSKDGGSSGGSGSGSKSSSWTWRSFIEVANV